MTLSLQHTHTQVCQYEELLISWPQNEKTNNETVSSAKEWLQKAYHRNISQTNVWKKNKLQN